MGYSEYQKRINEYKKAYMKEQDKLSKSKLEKIMRQKEKIYRELVNNNKNYDRTKELLKMYANKMVEERKERENLSYPHNILSVKESNRERINTNNIYNWREEIENSIGNYTIFSFNTVDGALDDARKRREAGYRVKIVNYEKMADKDPKHCVVYISNWTKDQDPEKGTPRWK